MVAPTTAADPFTVLRPLDTGGGRVWIHDLRRLGEATGRDPTKLPFSIRVLLESVLRSCDGVTVTEDDVRRLAAWGTPEGRGEVPFIPARVVLQDFTGVPCIADLAAMRDAVARLGGDAARINPLVPVDLVIDHSVQVDVFGTSRSLARNEEMEFARNRERYEFLRWGQKSLRNLRVVPPATGIVHQVNLEYLSRVVWTHAEGDRVFAFPDTLVGTDSHTTMINGLGVVGWGVGGIEAEAAMLGQPIYLRVPEVIGVRLTGRLREGVTATDLTLTVTELLRKRGVVERFVEFAGPGLASMSLPDRATIANMAPEYGATMGYFPVDEEAVRYLRLTGRRDAADLTERYCREQSLFRDASAPEPTFTDLLELDLDSVEPSVAGPKRPQDRVPLARVKEEFRRSLTAPVAARGYGLAPEDAERCTPARTNGEAPALGHGAVVIAAITSCTNTSNPSVMLGAGLLAKKAREKGLTVPWYVKTSLAPGSRVVTDYLRQAGVLDDLEALGFDVVGYGCTTCIGNSGPLPEKVAGAVRDGGLVAAAVLSGNRNFEGRVHPLTRANYLASPPLVVAYALAGTTNIDFATEPIGRGTGGEPVYLRDIWPSPKEIGAVLGQVRAEMFTETYAHVFEGSETWRALPAAESGRYDWNPESTYIRRPPFFDDLRPVPAPVTDWSDARALVCVGDSVTTDHISPAGDIAENSPAARWLVEHGVQKKDFNSYGSRRGNHEVMARGTFANIRLKNLLVPGVEGNVTVLQPSGERMSVYDAAVRYGDSGTPLLVLAGKEYGSGSSRDWAAKGPLLLGVRAVIAESFERIHCANLVGMGVLPLEYLSGESAESLGLTGLETYDVRGAAALAGPRARVRVVAHAGDGRAIEFETVARLDTPIAVEYFRHGGILPAVLRKLLAGGEGRGR
jgi:aconitate hydratase